METSGREMFDFLILFIGSKYDYTVGLYSLYRVLGLKQIGVYWTILSKNLRLLSSFLEYFINLVEKITKVKWVNLEHVACCVWK